MGGNVSVIQRSIGTNTQLKADGKILFLEDTGEPATKLKEILTQFKRSGTFNAQKAVIWGNFTHAIEEEAKYQFVREEFAQMLDEHGIPLIHSTRFGHEPWNDPLPFNTPATLSFNSSDEVLIKVQTNN